MLKFSVTESLCYIGKDDENITKTTNFLSHHNSKEDFLKSLDYYNHEFPETKVSIIGFIKDEFDNKIVVEQKFIANGKSLMP